MHDGRAMELKQARVLVVGATGAVGGAIAVQLAEKGARLAVAGRDKDALNRIADRVGAEHRTVLDLVDVEGTAGAVAKAAQVLRGLDGIVVAAGVAAFGPAREEDDTVVAELFAINTLGPIAAVRAALPHLTPGSAIAVVTAVLADAPTAGMAAYSASKAATSAWLTALRREVRMDRLSVLDARPPHMDTGLANRAISGTTPRMPKGQDMGEVVDLIVQGMVEGRRELVYDLAERRVDLR